MLSKTHYSDVIITATASQITSVSVIYSMVCSGTDQRKHEISASLAFVRGIHRWLVNSLHKGPVTRKYFLLMTSSWCACFVGYTVCTSPTLIVTVTSCDLKSLCLVQFSDQILQGTDPGCCWLSYINDTAAQSPTPWLCAVVLLYDAWNAYTIATGSLPTFAIQERRWCINMCE